MKAFRKEVIVSVKKIMQNKISTSKCFSGNVVVMISKETSDYKNDTEISNIFYCRNYGAIKGIGKKRRVNQTKRTVTFSNIR